MAAIGPTLFAAVVWGAIALVAVVFVYECYAILQDVGVL